MLRFLAPALILVTTPAVAATGCATRPPPPEVIVKTEQDPIAVNERSNLQEMGELLGKKGFHPSGIYNGSIGARWSTTSALRPEGRQFCVYLSRIVVTLHLEKPTIRLGRDLIGNRCARDSVWQHEIVHYRIDQHIMNRHASLIRQAIEEMAGRSTGMVAPNREEAGQASSRLADTVDKAAKWAIENMNWERDRLQDSLDTPSEYARTGHACADGILGSSHPLLCNQRPDLCTALDRP